MASYRKEKLEELIKRIIADAMISEIKDPRIGFATVTRVDLKKDYSRADVWISVIGDDTEKRKTMAGLASARPYLQHLVGKNIRLRTVPHLEIHLDTSIEEGSRIVGLINDLDSKE